MVRAQINGESARAGVHIKSERARAGARESESEKEK